MTNSNQRAIFFLFALSLIFYACHEDNLISNQLIPPESQISLEEFNAEIFPTMTGTEKDFYTLDFISSQHPQIIANSKTRSIHPLVELARLNLYVQDDLTTENLWGSIINKVGYPIWDEAIVFSEEDHTLSIPFTTFQDTVITGYMIGQGVEENSKFHFQLIEKSNIDQLIIDYDYPNAIMNQAFSVLSILHYSFDILGSKLSNYKDWLEFDENGASDSSERFTQIEWCFEVFAFVVPDSDQQISVEREVACRTYEIPCGPSDTGGGSCMNCANDTPGSSSSGGSSSGSGNSNPDNTDRPDPIEDGGNTNGTGGHQQELEECLANTDEYITKNAFTIIGFKTKGIILDEECCDAPDFEVCAWDKIKAGYGFNFSKEDYDTYVKAFIKDNLKSNIDRLLELGVDLNECMASADPKGCIWESIISPLEDEIGDDYDFILENLPVDGRVITVTMDWGTATSQEKVQHVVDTYRLLNLIHLCKRYTAQDDFLTYNFRDQFFTNISGEAADSEWIGGAESWVKSVDVTIPGVNGDPVTFDLALAWILFEPQDFRWEVRETAAAMPGANSSDYFGVRPSGPIQPNNAVFIMTVPQDYGPDFYNYFRPCD